MKTVYKIVKYELKGATFYTSEEMPELEERELNGRKEYFYKGTNRMYIKSHLWELTTNPNPKAYSHLETFLPYFADVTQDLPSNLRFKPKTYYNCQLMSEKHGAYLQFYHKPTKQILRIAMNSHYYTPINVKKNLVLQK